jgi:hypothetical protein
VAGVVVGDDQGDENRHEDDAENGDARGPGHGGSRMRNAAARFGNDFSTLAHPRKNNRKNIAPAFDWDTLPEHLKIYG